MSNTRESVSSGYPNTEKRVEKYDVQRSIFDGIRGVWMADETLSSVWYIFSIETKAKELTEEVKSYANWDQVSKPPSRLQFPLF